MIYAVVVLLAIVAVRAWWRECQAVEALEEAQQTIQSLRRTVRAAEEAGIVRPIVVTYITRRCEGGCVVRSLN